MMAIKRNEFRLGYPCKAMKIKNLWGLPYLSFPGIALRASLLWMICSAAIATSPFGVTLTEIEIDEIAKEIATTVKDVDIGNGVVGRHVFALGRTIFYQYDVSDDWQPFDDAKEQMIAMSKAEGKAKYYFSEGISNTFQYFKGNRLAHQIIIKASQYSMITFELEKEYTSIENHGKSKSINMKLRRPKGWSVEESSGPNTVKVFKGNPGTYQIITKDAAMFATRSQYKELFYDANSAKDYAEKFIPKNSCELFGAEPVSVTMNTYPALTFEYQCNLESLVGTHLIITKMWVIFYEDKMVMLSGSGTNIVEFNQLKKLYTMVSATVSFPEQYN